jgi:hypothetical protein
MRYFACLFFFVVAVDAIAQIDSADLHNFRSQVTKSELISKYRSLIVDNVIENNRSKTRELFFETLLKYDNDYYITFYPSEKILIGLWLGDYEYIFSEVLAIDSTYIANYNRKVTPKEDQLFRILIQTVGKDSERIAAMINGASLISAIDREFLKLLLLTFTIPNGKQYQETVNNAASDFLVSCPNSRFEGYVRNFIRYKYSPRGLLFDFALYSGSSFFTGKTADYFRSGGVMGCGFALSYSDIMLNFRGGFVFSRLKNDITYNSVVWEDNECAQVFLLELSLGYRFRVNKKFCLSPIVGVAGFSGAPYENDKQKHPELKDISIDSDAVPVVGIDFNYVLYDYYYNNYLTGKLMYAFYAIDLRYTFQPVKFPEEYAHMNGITHNVSLGLTFGFGRARREL